MTSNLSIIFIYSQHKTIIKYFTFLFIALTSDYIKYNEHILKSTYKRVCKFIECPKRVSQV